MRLLRLICLLLVLMLPLLALADKTITINVYNWGMNIADGTDDTLDVIAAFEAKYPHI